METAIQQFNNLPSNSAEVERFSNMLIEEIKGGIFNPLDLVVIRKCMEEIFEKVKPVLDAAAVEEAQKYPEKTFRFRGLNIEKSAFTRYDYANCGHPKYAELTAKAAQIKAEQTALTKFLQAVKSPMLICDESTGGEEITINPPIKLSSDILRTKLDPVADCAMCEKGEAAA